MILEIPSLQIRELFADLGVPGSAVFLGDDVYALLDEADISARLALNFNDLLAQLGFKYETERRDCDDFARLAAAWAGYLHGEQTDAGDSGLAFGEVWCAAKAHAFCFAVHRSDAEVLYLRFYEPQLSANGFSLTPIELSRTECESIFLVKA